ncbi:MAG: ExeA family protein [Halioglobus sp.]
MQYALEQGDGILMITGRSGTGKTTLADFLVNLKRSKMQIATLATTDVGGDGLLRMVAYKFGLEAKDLDKATLLRELEAFLRRQSRTLLIIDEAQNLSAASLEELRMLTNMRLGSRPLLQVFLLGHPQLHDLVHTAEMEQLHQRVTATCILQPLSLSETQDYVQHYLNSAGWRGSPVITTDSFVLIHRFSQGLPRYINKLCNRLFLRGFAEQRSQLDMDDVVTVIQEIEHELLLPLPDTTHQSVCDPLPPIQALVDSKAKPIAQRLNLTEDERAFLQSNPPVLQAPPAPVPDAVRKPEPIPMGRRRVGATRAVASSAYSRSQVVYLEVASAGRKAVKVIEAIKAIDFSPYQERLLSICRSSVSVHRESIASGAVAMAVIVGAYQLDSLNAGEQQLPDQNVALMSVPERQAVESAADTDLELDQMAPLSTNRNSLLNAVSASTKTTDSDPLEAIDTIQPSYDTEDPMSLAQVAKYFPVAANRLLGETPHSLPYAVAVPHFVSKPQTANTEVLQPESKPAQQPEPINGQRVSLEADAAPEIESVVAGISMDAADIPVESHMETPDTSPELTAQVVQEIREEKIQELLQLGEEAVIADRLRLPKERNAWHFYKEVLEIDPNNQLAEQGLQRIAARYAQLTTNAIQMQQYDKAQVFIKRGLGVVQGDDKLLALQLDVNAGQAELLAMQDREDLLAMQATESVSLSPVIESETASRGLFGALKSFFSGGKKRASTQ